MSGPKMAANGVSRYGQPRPTAEYGMCRVVSAQALVQYHGPSSPCW